uniref:Putative secreted protein n=1 Tax=Ixodes ricinus TaxID=34613 RepID=A0A6B0U751_IXORI
MSCSVLAPSWVFAFTSCVHYTSCDEDQGTGTDGVPAMDALVRRRATGKSIYRCRLCVRTFRSRSASPRLARGRIAPVGRSMTPFNSAFGL